MTKPNSYQTVMITYRTYVGYGPYGDIKKLETVKRKAFYTKSSGYYDSKDNWVSLPDDGSFQVPQKWGDVHTISGNTMHLPIGKHNYGRVLFKDIIKWEVIN